MSEPLVRAVMLTKDRPVMAARAVRCFEQQTYANKRLLIINTGLHDLRSLGGDHVWLGDQPSSTIGELRNYANSWATDNWQADIIMHFDDDDWSHPKRMEEQVAFLIESEADMVGYSDLLLWEEAAPIRDLDAVVGRSCHTDFAIPGEAYLYTRGSVFNVPGTSLCYWRKTWENRKFRHLPQLGNPQSSSEDTTWENENGRIAAMPSVLPREGWPLCWRWSGASMRRPQDAIKSGGWAEKHPQWLVSAASADSMPPAEPRMIATIHGSNTRNYDVIHRTVEYKRVPQWDAYCLKSVRL